MVPLDYGLQIVAYNIKWQHNNEKLNNNKNLKV
jgi:hypothetical protein